MVIRRVRVVHHLLRPEALSASHTAVQALESRGISVTTDEADTEYDLVLALGGDGTILAGAEYAHRDDVPLLGVNMGHMGFLAEVGAEGIYKVVDQLAAGTYRVDTRATLDVTVTGPDGSASRDWALNEAALIHTNVAHPVQLALVVDGQDVSTYGADGMVLATPTGSTAYSFSAGGPVVWPDAEAMIIAPLAAHGLFTRPLVVGPASTIDLVVLHSDWEDPEMWCDGRRRTTLAAGSTVRAQVSDYPIRLLRLDDTPFATRLVHKFSLPVRGWRQHSMGVRTADTGDMGADGARAGIVEPQPTEPATETTV